MKKIIILFIFIGSSFLLSDTLLIQAQEYEKQGDYKNAMLVYKQIALANQPKDIEDEENTLSSQIARERFAKEYIRSNDLETQLSINQIISSEFGIYAYKKNYFAPVSYSQNHNDGRQNNEAKFQISIRKPIIHNLFGFDESIEFGYTQTSWWQLYDNSSPFRETNYSPEVYTLFFNKDSNAALKLYKIGFIHESNGKDGEKSRSWNRIYTEGTFQVGHIFVTPKLWYRIPEKAKNNINQTSGDDNPDIMKYYGYGELSIKYPYKQHLFELNFRNNLRKNNKHSSEFIWTFPLNSSKPFGKYFGFIQLQSGYGDSLIDYNKHSKRATLGIAFSR
ncbi:phospholipase A [Arcobacter sp. FWKO B]|uniref:phospholipase A n=1 Tax=Arcobacter sp. FWKO B TaxID=2593672 RepID=UPI0018A44FDF|nr:phospholipase A [Arcobacter sp. FWKO B]QOG11522.1 phospholipase A [Arcobacter sp. FWKO B]